MRVRSLAVVIVMLGVGSAPFACGGGTTSSSSASNLPQGVVSEAVNHEACAEAGHRVDAVDEDGDKKPDIKSIYDKTSNVLLCRIIDLNHDGKPDLFQYFDASGTLRRVEYCFTDDGAVNAIEEYQGGKLVKRSYDTTGQHKIDTWDTFDPNAPIDPKTGRPVNPLHRERDTSGDGKVDQWWDWAPDGTITIAMDRTGSGRPDPATKIVIEAGTNAAAADASATATATNDASTPSPSDTSAVTPDGAAAATTPPLTASDAGGGG